MTRLSSGLSILSFACAIAGCSGSSPDGAFAHEGGGDAGGGDSATTSASAQGTPSDASSNAGSGGDDAAQGSETSAVAGTGGDTGDGGSGGSDAVGRGGDDAATSTSSGDDASSSSGGDPLPNLRFVTTETSYFHGGERVHFCLNQQPDGDEVDYGDEIIVANLGDADAGSYHLVLSLYAPATGEETICANDLDDSTGVEAGGTARWAGPFCCDFGEIVPGDYKLRIAIDAYDEVLESDEGDNLYESDEIDLD